ncbi:MAG: MBL fold metallo-hydrolase [Saprospiraceae bacterium]
MSLLLCFYGVLGVGQSQNLSLSTKENPNDSGIYLVVLGTVQDAGSPHIGCRKSCCKHLFVKGDSTRKVVSLGMIDQYNSKKYLIEATPDITTQLRDLSMASSLTSTDVPDGIFLTHAHIGHYAGLMYLGREALGASHVPVYAMPMMQKYLESNGPWDQLVNIKNIKTVGLHNETAVKLSDSLSIVPFLVPHRGEYSETVGYKIIGPSKTVLFIPDIDKWHLWDKSILDELESVDYAFIDATFYDAAEVNHRNISEIPHPFIEESMQLFENLPIKQKNKVHFIHFNHTNPALNDQDPKSKVIYDKGFNIAKYGQIIRL